MHDERPTTECLFADFVSRDPQRVWSATWAVLRTRDADVLAFLAGRSGEIERATNGVELGGAFTSNRRSLELALEKLALAASGAACLCTLYPRHVRLDPRREQQAGHVTIVDEVTAPYAARFVCACVDCGARYEVQEGEDHATWWEWKRTT